MQTNGCSSLIIHFIWGVQLFWAAFDMPMTVVPLKDALGLEKFDFWAFHKNNHEESLGYTWCDYFLKCPKINFFHPKATFNGTTAMIGSKAAQNN